MLKRLFFIYLLLICLKPLPAQHNSVVDVGRIQDFQKIDDKLSFFTDISKSYSIHTLDPSLFKAPAGKTPFNERRLEARHFIRLTVTNSGNRDTCWLYMGKAQQYVVYEYDSVAGKMLAMDNRFELYSDVLMNKIPYCRITVKKGETKDYYIQAEIDFYNWQQFDPVIVIPGEQTSFAFIYFIKPSRVYLYVTLVLLSIMLCMFAYTLALFFRTFQTEYLYYSGAIFIFIIYFTARMLNVFRFGEMYFFLYDFRYQVLQLSGNMLILLFITAFLKLKEKNPKLYTLFQYSIVLQILFLLINVPLTYSNKYNFWGNMAFDVIRTCVLLYSVYLIVVLLAWKKEKEATYLGIGSFVAILMAFVALYVDRWSGYDYLLLRYTGIPVLIFMFGVLLQMFLFMQGLAYRTRKQEAERVRAVEQLQLENDRKELEKYKAIIDARETERNRISQEIHDDIGSGLTSIRLLSEIAKAKCSDPGNKEIEKISATSNVLMDKMNEIIWTLNSRNDSLPNLIAYLRHHIVEYFESLNIHLYLSVPDTINEISISGKIRRNILLSVKEALHNIVKHSQATEVNVRFLVNDFFSIAITDNGVGFNSAPANSHGNGLHNMKERLSTIGGTCTIINNGGTSIVFKVPLANYPL
ncbi:MAG: hypothetical protein KF862_26025 [Chitinophagaceae bacterium]|nr:hypothetical protein [Chitinophagaceae bacterium]